MTSYASIDRVEDGIVVCEVENVSMYDCTLMPYGDRPTVMIETSLKDIEDDAGNVEEGDILVVEHDGKHIYYVLEKDEEEKQRRIDTLRAVIEQ